MDNGLLTFNLRVPVGLQVVSHLVNENTILEQFLLILSSTLSGCKYERYRKDIEGFTNGPLAQLGRMELQSALTLFASKIADHILSDFVPELAALTGQSIQSVNMPVIDNVGKVSTAPSDDTPEDIPVPAEPEPEPEAPAPEVETKKQLSEFASKNLAGFPQFSEEKIQTITDLAAANIQSIAAKSGIPPEEIPKAAQLAFYDFQILYDDSGSMNSEDSRIPTTQETVKGLYKAAKTLNPDNKFSIRSFEGSEFDNVASETELDDIVSSMTFDTGANVAKPLRKKILEPLATAAMENRLNPTIVVIITDGDLGSTVPEFTAQVTKFKSQLDGAKNTGPAVLFCLCRVGNDESAARSLKELNSEAGTKDLIFYGEDPIDDKLQSVGGDIDAYVGVIISDLIKAMDLQTIQ
ncbi:hypothetical protein POX_c03952 [Penicillium oxalicum]|uniref:VWFA domain-containing protein n=1 Tax=Penicillium oxalicum (strain 114-2 / CGMCC 5302) TaxID=933388 RepID=S7Z4X7_PENO1|nr:hypothetical protein POX_c03952 [Penicillium oxalicum]EPS25575.1 hypothetical protein PDE_00509 [Penicillium oxalicum 114-2]KAI2791097.1 hypothetical protein POX_c03952 [Penicillium oxalicum]